jgi:RNA polymerase primary sigma factor
MRNRVLNIYLKEIVKIPPLTREEEWELIKRVKEKKDPIAREKLIVRLLPSVVKIAQLYKNSGVPLGDLIDEGNVGLIKAIERYKIRKGVRFVSYAVWWIKHHIHTAIYDSLKVVRIPSKKIKSGNIIRNIEKELIQQLGRLPSTKEIADTLKISESEVTRCVEYLQTDFSLNLKDEKAESSLLDFIKSEPEKLEDDTIRKLLAGEIEEKLNDLSEIERKIIKMRFGLNGMKVHTLKEIGKKFDLSKERIRQIEERALEKLRKEASK